MRPLALLLITTLAVAAGTSPAAASGPLTTETQIVASLAPGRGAPSTRRPRALRVAVLMRWGKPVSEERRTLQHVSFLFPRGSVYNGAKFPRCGLDVLSRGTMKPCPKGSMMGRGRATADADTSPTEARITVFNGGPTRVYFFVEMDNPAVVRAPVIGRVTKRSGRWAYQLDLDVPRELQVVGGVPIVMNEVRVSVGRKDWLAATSWPTAVGVSTTLGFPGIV